MIMNKDRDNIRELLSAYIDGEATEDQARTVEQAVAKDPELALELHELNAAKRLVTGLPIERAPRGFVRKVMMRAERKHLLGDHQAGGSFGAARWITLAVAAVVLLTAGIGIIALNMLKTGQRPPPIAILDVDGRTPGGPGDVDSNGELLHGKADGGRSGMGEKAGAGYADNNVVNTGGKIVVADAAFDYAVAHAQNATIYTPNVTDTLAVLNESFLRNDIQPLELDDPGRDSKAAQTPPGKAAEKRRGVSRGGLNFYFNKKQDDEQVQIVVLATDTVIEQLNGDLDKLASAQPVSQAPVSDDYRGTFDDSVRSRRTGRQGQWKDARPGVTEEGEMIDRVDGVADPTMDEELGSRAKSKKAPDGFGGGGVVAKGAPARVMAEPTAPKTVKPSVDTPLGIGEIVMLPPDVAPGDAPDAAHPAPKQPSKAISQTGDTAEKNAPVPVTTVTVTGGGRKYESIDKDGMPMPAPMPKPKAAPPKGSVSGPTTRPAEPVLANGGIQKGFGNSSDGGDLKILSAEIAKGQKRGESSEQLDVQYSKLNSAFRQQILNDDLRRNVQSQRAQGVNVQALVININRRRLINTRGAATRNAILQHYDRALSRPRDAAASSPDSGSTTQRAVQPADTSR